jgi:hypothetical protein
MEVICERFRCGVRRLHSHLEPALVSLPRATSNQVMERTADRCTLHFEMTAHFQPERRAASSAVAHLVLVRW